jgi:GH25 family lysozyme M1 (1,4-beta-N-acetylmuramidase)
VENRRIKRGVDISYYQKKVDFQVMASRGVERIYMRAAYGTRKDVRFAEYWQHSLGVIPERGVYLYFLASKKPEEQAEKLHEIVLLAGAGMPDQPCALDIEYNSIDGEINAPAKYRDYPQRVLRCMERIEALFEKRPIIYSNPSMILTQLKDPHFSTYGLWIANPDERAPRVPLPWAPGLHTGWQYNFRNTLGKWYGVESAAIGLDLWYE